MIQDDIQYILAFPIVSSAKIDIAINDLRGAIIELEAAKKFHGERRQAAVKEALELALKRLQ